MNWRHQLLRFWNLYPPFLGAGIVIEEVTPNYDYVRVKLKKRVWTSNYVGTQFGGAMFMMTDPFYMVMLINRLGRDYIVWDKAASINYIKPGRTTVRAEFKVDDVVLAEIRQAAAGGEKLNWKFNVDLVSDDGILVAQVEKTLYIRRKDALAHLPS